MWKWIFHGNSVGPYGPLSFHSKEIKFPPGNLLFVSTVEKFQIPEYRKGAILAQGPVTMSILPLT